MDTCRNLTDLPTLGDQDALMAEETKVIAAEPVIAAVYTVHNDALMDVNEDDDRVLKSVVGFDEVERVGVKRKLRELQRKRRAKRRKVPISVAEMFFVG